jgi:hypothetical protein
LQNTEDGTNDLVLLLKHFVQGYKLYSFEEQIFAEVSFSLYSGAQAT